MSAIYIPPANTTFYPRPASQAQTRSRHAVKLLISGAIAISGGAFAFTGAPFSLAGFEAGTVFLHIGGVFLAGSGSDTVTIQIEPFTFLGNVAPLAASTFVVPQVSVIAGYTVQLPLGLGTVRAVISSTTGWSSSGGTAEIYVGLSGIRS